MTPIRKLAVATAVATAGLLALAGPASAHVSVDAPGATRGGADQVITFRVPVEEDVDTVKVAISLPTDTPIASVDVAPVAGWTHTEKTVKLATPIKTDDGEITEAVSEIVWTAAAGQGLKQGEYGEFRIIAGLLPDVDSLRFGAVQTYSDGTVVKWIETAAPGSSTEPEHPAPELKLAAAASEGGSASPSATAAVVTAPKAAKADTSGAVTLAVIALVVAAASLGVAVVTRTRAGRGR